MSLLIRIGLPVALVLGIFFLGPAPYQPIYKHELPKVEDKLTDLEEAIRREESKFKIKPDNHSRILWAGSEKEKTPYALLYLHGFGASWKEGSPVNEMFAARYKINAYLPRLFEHGLITKEPMLKLTPDRLYENTLLHFARALKLGEKIIVMGGSTGGTLALMLAAHFPDKIHGLIVYSPNVELGDPRAKILTYPWGLYIGRMILGSKYRRPTTKEKAKKYWYSFYRLEAAVNLQMLVSSSMSPELFSKVRTPSFIGFYYLDEENQDRVISIPAIYKMAQQVSIPKEKIKIKAFPKANAHVITSDLASTNWQEVADATFLFADKVLGLKAEKNSKVHNR